MLWDNFNLTDKKAKAQTIERTDNYYKILLMTLMQMLEYDNIPEEINFRFFNQIELYKLLYGLCYVTVSDVTGELTVYHGNFGGAPDAYGIGQNFVGTTENGEAINEPWTNGIVFRNNKIYESEIDNLYRYAVSLNNNDVALNCLVQYSMVTPFAFVKDSKMLKAINKFLESSLLGKPLFMQMSDKNIFAKEINNSESIEKLDIMDPELASKLQYISQYTDDLKRRFYTYYGHSMAGAHKMAQQSVDEICANDTISMIYPEHRLAVAKEDIEAFNKKFGYDVTVNYSLAWGARQDDVIDSIKEENTDEVEESVVNEDN